MAGYASNGKPSKKQLSRIVVCSSCHKEGDDVLGNTFASRTCARCQKPIEAGVVVQLPAPMRYHGMNRTRAAREKDQPTAEPESGASGPASSSGSGAGSG